MDSLSSLLGTVSPAHAALLVGLLWGLRELFAFVRKMIEMFLSARTESKMSQTDVDVRLISEALKRVADHIEQQTNLIRGFVHQLDSMAKLLEDLRDEVKDLQKAQPPRPN